MLPLCSLQVEAGGAPSTPLPHACPLWARSGSPPKGIRDLLEPGVGSKQMGRPSLLCQDSGAQARELGVGRGMDCLNCSSHHADFCTEAGASDISPAVLVTLLPENCAHWSWSYSPCS